MSEAAARAIVYAIVNATTDAGKVYDYARWSSSWDDFLDQFKTTIGGTTQIRGWQVTYAGFAAPSEKLYAGPPGAESSVIVRPHVFKIMGYMSHSDANESEKTFAALAESIIDDLDTAATLHGGVYQTASPASIDFFGTVMLGAVLCDHAEITITINEVVTI